MGKRRSSSGASAASPGLPSPGDSIEVYWGGDKVYYPGTVHSYDPDAGTFKVNYVDGDVEDLNLNNEKWRMLNPNSLNGVPPPTQPTNAAAPVSVATEPPINPPVAESAPAPQKPEKDKVDTPRRASTPLKSPGNVHRAEPPKSEALKRARAPTPASKPNSGIGIAGPTGNIPPSEPLKRARRHSPVPAPAATTTPSVMNPASLTIPVPGTMPRPPQTPANDTVGTMSKFATEAARTVCTTALIPVKADVEALKNQTVEYINANKRIVDTIEAMVVKQEEVVDENKKTNLELAKTEAEKSRSVEKYVKNYLDEYFQGHKRETMRLSNRIVELEKQLAEKNGNMANGNDNTSYSSMGLMHSEALKIRQLVETEIKKKDGNHSNSVGGTDIEALVKKSIMPGVEKILVHFLKYQPPPPVDAEKRPRPPNPQTDRANSTPQRPPYAASDAVAVGSTANSANANTNTNNSTGGGTTESDDTVMKDVVGSPTRPIAPPSVEDVRLLVARRATQFLLDNQTRPKPPMEQSARNEWTKQCCLMCFKHVRKSMTAFKNYQDAKSAENSSTSLQLEWFTHPGIEAHILKARRNYDASWDPKLENQEWFAEAAVLREIGRRFRAAELILRAGDGAAGLNNDNAIHSISKVTQAAMEVD